MDCCLCIYLLLVSISLVLPVVYWWDGFRVDRVLLSLLSSLIIENEEEASGSSEVGAPDF
jgi:hypothetical protein